MIAITSVETQVLLDYIKNIIIDNTVVVFPENGISPKDIMSWCERNKHVETVITFSPIIISGCEKTIVLDNSNKSIKFGDSINKISMNIWSRNTVPDNVISVIESFRKDYDTKEDIENAIDEVYERVGDSVERTLLMTYLMHKEKSFDEGIE